MRQNPSNRTKEQKLSNIVIDWNAYKCYFKKIVKADTDDLLHRVDHQIDTGYEAVLLKELLEQ